MQSQHSQDRAAIDVPLTQLQCSPQSTCSSSSSLQARGAALLTAVLLSTHVLLGSGSAALAATEVGTPPAAIAGSVSKAAAQKEQVR